MSNEIYKTVRGFGVYADISDDYGNRVSVQQSSAAMEPCVWVGRHDYRAHLTVNQAIYVRDAITAWLADVGEAAEDTQTEPPERDTKLEEAIKILGGPHPANSGLDSFTLGWAVAKLEALRAV